MAIRYRRAMPADDRALHAIFAAAVNEIDLRLGSSDAHARDDTAAIEADWLRRRSLFEHLAATADEAWVAEDDGRVVGYARSIERDGLRDLTELFVHPDRQAGGIGRELLARALPAGRAERRVIIATLEPAALSRYLRIGVTEAGLLAFLHGAPGGDGSAAAGDSDPGGGIEVEPIGPTPNALDAVGAIDLAVLGHRRDPDHAWFLAGRHGLLFRRDRRPIGYGYVGDYAGPFAALDPADLPAIVVAAERVAAGLGMARLGLWVPLRSTDLVALLLRRGYRIDPFLCVLLADGPFSGIDRYVVTDPPFFL